MAAGSGSMKFWFCWTTGWGPIKTCKKRSRQTWDTTRLRGHGRNTSFSMNDVSWSRPPETSGQSMHLVASSSQTRGARPAFPSLSLCSNTTCHLILCSFYLQIFTFSTKELEENWLITIAHFYLQTKKLPGHQEIPFTQNVRDLSQSISPPNWTSREIMEKVTPITNRNNSLSNCQVRQRPVLLQWLLEVMTIPTHVLADTPNPQIAQSLGSALSSEF